MIARFEPGRDATQVSAIRQELGRKSPDLARLLNTARAAALVVPAEHRLTEAFEALDALAASSASILPDGHPQPFGAPWQGLIGTAARLGVQGPVGYFRVCSLTKGGCVAWILRLVKIGGEGEGSCTDVMQVNRPDDLGDIANLGLTLAEAKRLLTGVQREIAAAQAREHAARRPECPRCDRACCVKEYRDHAVATLFGEVTVRLARFRCPACGGIQAGIAWPAHCRSTPELDRLQAHLCALMTYRTAAALLEQMFPVEAGKHHETLRRHTLKVGEALGECAAIRPETAAPAIVVTLDSTFIRSCADGERHLEV